MAKGLPVVLIDPATDLAYASGGTSTQLPASLGPKTGAASLSVVPNTDTPFPATDAGGSFTVDTGTPGTFGVSGLAATGAAVSGNPVLVAGSDGTNARSLSVNSIGRIIPAGDTNAGAADGGAPIKIGGFASSTAPTAVTTGQRVNAWYSLSGAAIVSAIDANGNAPVASTLAADALPTTVVGMSGRNFGFVFNGTTWDRARGDINGTVNQPYALASSRWGYAAAAGGISNTTTAVTIIAAAGAGVRNYVTGIQIDAGALGAATEIAIRDGAGGTVLWRGFITTGGAMRQVEFGVPLKGTANTLMEVVTLTASVTGSVYFNAQGFQGA